MTYLNRDSAQKLLDTRPQGTNVQDALKALADRGFTIEGYNDGSKGSINEPQQSTLSKVGEFGQKLVGDIVQPFENLAKTSRALSKTTGQYLADKVKGNDTSFSDTLNKNIQNVNQDKTIGSMLLDTPAVARDITTPQGVEQTLGDVGQGLLNVSTLGEGTALKSGVKTAVKTGVKYGAGYGATEAMQEGGEIKDILTQGATGGALGAGVGLGGALITKGVEKLVNTNLSKIVSDTETKLGRKLSQDEIGKINTFTQDHIKTQLADSAKRLETAGIDSQKLYQKYTSLESGAKKSVLANTALEDTGKEIGQSFDMLAKKRQAVGKQVGSELSKIQNENVDVTNRVKDFKSEIKSNINSFTDSEKQMFKILQKEQVPTTVKGITDYITRMKNTFAELKGKNGITGTTNAERIASNFINGLKKDINNLYPEYGKLSAEYSRLSSILKEGEGIVGKKLSTGEYKSSTSAAKSSLNSILNGGKKDFLINLGNETGNPLLDKALVAAQAMADMGDKKGESLLQGMLGEGVPTKKGVLMGLVDYGVNAAKEKVLGTKPERTANYLGQFKKLSK